MVERRKDLRQGLRRGAGLSRRGSRVVTRRTLSSAAGVAVDLTVELCGTMLTTPLIPAAGTFSKEMLGEASGVYGAILPKTVTPRPRTGNPPPRVAEAPSGMINSIGLQNPGLEN